MAERIYVDVLKKSTEADTIANYYAVYQGGILSRPCDYYLDIDRFSFPLDSIPILIFEPNAYKIELTYGEFTSGEINVDYIPSNPTWTINNERYYYVFHFDVMLRMINDAISRAAEILRALSGHPTTNPYLYIDYNAGKLLKYTAPNDCDIFLPNHVKFFMNKTLYKLMYGMPSYYDFKSSGVRSAQINAFNTGNNQDANGLFTMTTNRGTQTICSWNVCRGLVISTSRINCELEDMPITNQSSIVDKRNILTNFDLVYTSENPTPDVAKYLPTLYRHITLYGSGILDTIDFTISWYDVNNQIYQLHIDPGNALSMRLVFTKKNSI